MWPVPVTRHLFLTRPQERIAAELEQLRTTVCLFFFMINLVFVVAIFNLQLHQDELHLNWPFGAMHDISYTEDATGRSVRVGTWWVSWGSGVGPATGRSVHVSAPPQAAPMPQSTE